MTAYSGPATVTTIPVTAHLRARQVNGRADWHGELIVADGLTLLNVHEGRLRLPHGRESGFVRTGGGFPGGRIQVEGSSGDELL
jgi:hypothetical protein